MTAEAAYLPTEIQQCTLVGPGVSTQPRRHGIENRTESLCKPI